MADIEFHGIDKRFDGGHCALQGIDLRVADGEFLVLVGPSGSGKSTLLRILCGLESASAGEIQIGGRRVDQLPPQQRDLAMVFQNYALYPHMTVAQNLAFPLKMRKVPKTKRDARVEEIARLLDLEPLLKRRPSQLSGGQSQRVAMGRALVREPQVFLMDEPLSNLDARLRVQIRGEIAALQRRLCITTVYVTHDQVEAMTLGHRVAVLHQGRIQQVADPRTLYTEPANAFVAGFIGNPGMNLLPARIESVDGRRVIVSGPLTLPCPESVDAPPNDDLRLGIRAEDFTADEIDSKGPVRALAVETVEDLGHEELVHLRWDHSATVVARLPGGRWIIPGDEVALRVEEDRFFLFGADGGRIWPGSP